MERKMKENSDFRYDLEYGRQEGEKWFEKILGLESGNIEVKSDRKSQQTGNIFIEYESRGKLSGIATTQAKYLVYKVDAETAFIWGVNEFKRKIKDLYNRGIARKIVGGDNNTSKGLLIKIKDLFN
jgi:hypothetical protein